MLHKYYEAKTSLEEESILNTFFRDTPAEEIPKSLADDRRLFLSIAELHTNSADPEIPEGLLEQIMSISGMLDDNIYSSRKQRKWRPWITYTVSAACVCMLAFGVGLLTVQTDHTHQLPDHVAERPNERTGQKLDEHIEVNAVAEPSKPEYLVKSHEMHGGRSKKAIANSSVEEDGFIEITDPEEAEKIVIEIGKLLSINSQKTNEAIRNLEKTVENYKEITKSILQ